MSETKKVYVLELIGDIVSTPGCVTLEIGGVSNDRKKLEKLLETKEKELLEYMSEPGPEDDDDGCTYRNYDLDGYPVWNITEHTLL